MTEIASHDSPLICAGSINRTGGAREEALPHRHAPCLCGVANAAENPAGPPPARWLRLPSGSARQAGATLSKTRDDLGTFLGERVFQMAIRKCGAPGPDCRPHGGPGA